MTRPIILASGSEARCRMLANIGLDFEQIKPRVDEETIKDSLLSEGLPPRDIADALAEAKARRVSAKEPQALVIGSDQVLEFDGRLLSKPFTPGDAVDQLKELSAKSHKLLSAAVLFEDGRPVWRHISEARLTMRKLSDGYIDEYVARNWDSIRHSVGGYKIEEEGGRLFVRVDGTAFTIMGLPLFELVSYLSLRGYLTT
ncbi:MAG: Maf-like protein [Rhodobacteraceae bacterium]|nr:Maf-like protein [Paracoccaceae bacterium]